MELKEAENKLEKLVGFNFCSSGEEEIDNYAVDFEELTDFIDNLDESKIVESLNEDDFENYTISTYGFDSDDDNRDYLGVILLKGESVIVYGYSSD